MATSNAPLLAPPRSSYQITGSLTPAVKIRSWRRFAASRCEVSLLPTLRLRLPSRRRNALRKKAWPPPPLDVQNQVRLPYGESPEVGSLDSQEPKFGCLDGETSSQFDDRSDISSSLGASRSRNVASESELEGEKDLIGVADEEITFCGTGAGSMLSVHEDPEGNVHVDVEEDEIINRSGDLDVMLYGARGIAKELGSGGRGAPKNSSLFHFVAAGRMASPVLNGEVSVAQRKAAPFLSAPWSGFAVLCSVCLVCAVSKFIWRTSEAKLLSRFLYMRRLGMKGDELDKGNMRMLENLHGFPGNILRQPHLDRKQLMNNIKRAKESREWFVLSSSFLCKSVTNDDANITEIRKTVAEVHTPEEGSIEQSIAEENNGTVFPHPIVAIDEEVSASYGNQSYINDVSESRNLTFISPSDDKIEESVEQIADMKNGEMVMNTSEKDQDGIGERELTVLTYDEERVTGGNDRTSVIHASEKEAKFDSANDHNLGPNSISTKSSELESKEQFAEIRPQNVDFIQGIKQSVLLVSEMIYAKGNAHQFNINEVSETPDVLPSDCFNISSSELRNNKTTLDINVKNLSGIQGIEVSKTFTDIAQTSHHEEFSDNASIIGTEASENPLIADTGTSTSFQRSRKVPADLRRDNMQPVQEPEPTIYTGNGKQLSHANEQHNERTKHNEMQTRLETENTGILDNGSTSSVYTPQEETFQPKFVEPSSSEKKKEKRTSSNKKPRARGSRNKGKLQKEVCINKETEAKQSEQGVPGTNTVIDPSNCVRKTKVVTKKRLKKMQNELQRVSAQDDNQGTSMVDQKNNRCNVRRTRKKNLKNVSHNQGSQTRDENLETAHVVSSPDNAPTDI